MGITKKLLFDFLLLLLLLLCTASCNTTEPPDPPVPPEPILKLELEDVSCTEAWIKLTTNNLQSPATINLLKDNAITKTINLQTADTLLYIDSLLPNQTYNFHSVIQSFNQSSNEISVTTMDTTSHNFDWQTFTFGDIGNSVLFDVAVISENNIWAVGEIRIADSTPKGYTTYNAVHWDGNDWNLKKITVNFRGFLITQALDGIFAFSPTQIWLAGGLTIFGDGTNWTPYDIRLITGIDGLSASKIWGSRPENMYFVGRNGSIAYYNGSQWRKIESGTSLPIRDIWGDFNTKTNNYEILSLAAEVNNNIGSKVLRIDGITVTEETNAGLSWDVGCLWFKPGSKYYIAGAGIHYKHFLSDSLWNSYPQGIVTNYGGYGIKGSDTNNIFSAGGFLEIAHFNWVS